MNKCFRIINDWVIVEPHKTTAYVFQICLHSVNPMYDGGHAKIFVSVSHCPVVAKRDVR